MWTDLVLANLVIVNWFFYKRKRIQQSNVLITFFIQHFCSIKLLNRFKTRINDVFCKWKQLNESSYFPYFSIKSHLLPWHCVWLPSFNRGGLDLSANDGYDQRQIIYIIYVYEVLHRLLSYMLTNCSCRPIILLYIMSCIKSILKIH